MHLQAYLTVVSWYLVLGLTNRPVSQSHASRGGTSEACVDPLGSCKIETRVCFSLRETVCVWGVEGGGGYSRLGKVELSLLSAVT